MRTAVAMHLSARSSILLVMGMAALAGIMIASSSPGVVALIIGSALLASMLVYCARMLSARVVIFGAFLVLLYAGSRDFAYLAIDIGHARLFVAELVLVVMWVSLVPQLVRRSPWPHNPLPVALTAYFGIGAIALIRCFPTYGLDALRDSALCYYAAAFPLTVFVASDERRLRSLLWFCWAGWVAAGAVVVAKYLFDMGIRIDYDLMRYGAGAQALACMSGMGSAIASCSPGCTRRLRTSLWVSGVALLLVGILLIQHRSLFLGTIGVAGAVAYCCLSEKWVRFTFVCACVFALVLSMSFVPWDMGRLPSFAADTIARIGSIIGHEDANASWRLEIWKRSISFGIDHPLLGAGFGRSLGDSVAFGETDRVDPHNSYIAIFYRMGFPGIIAFAILWVQVIGTAFSRCRSAQADRALLGMALSAHLAAAIFGLFNVVLEGPYMGIPFWVSLALVYQASRVVPSRGVKDDLRSLELRGAHEGK